MSFLGWDFRLYRRLIFLYHFKRNGMLLTAKSVWFFEMNVWPLSLRNFTILTQKLIPVEQCNDSVSQSVSLLKNIAVPKHA